MLHELALHVVSVRFHSFIELTIFVVLLQRAFSVDPSFYFLLLLHSLLDLFRSVNHTAGSSRCYLICCSLGASHACIFFLRLWRLLLVSHLETLHVHLLKNAHRRLTLPHHFAHLDLLRVLPLFFVHFFSNGFKMGLQILTLTVTHHIVGAAGEKTATEDIKKSKSTKKSTFR